MRVQLSIKRFIVYWLCPILESLEQFNYGDYGILRGNTKDYIKNQCTSRKKILLQNNEVLKNSEGDKLDYRRGGYY